MPVATQRAAWEAGGDRIGQGGSGQPLEASGGYGAIDARVAGCCPADARVRAAVACA